MDPMLWLALGASVAVLLLIAAALTLGSAGRKEREAVYQRREDALLTKTEQHFFHALDDAVGAEFRIMAKVRLGDIIRPRKGMEKSDWRRAFNRVSAKHVDFVLCDRESVAPCCVIELDDATHQRVDRAARDGFVDQALADAQLPIVHVPTQQRYERAAVREAIAAACATAPAQR